MSNDLFGGLGNLGGALGGLMGGLAKSGLMPQDTPEAKLLKSQSEVADLKKQEAEILIEIGRQAFEENQGRWPQADKLRLIRLNMDKANQAADALKREQEAAKQAKDATDAVGKCPSCGFKNPPGVKFCQECGSKLGASFCVSCGAELKPGTRFCGECGSKQND